MNQWKASIAQKCVEVSNLPLIVGRYCSTIDPHPLSNTLLCPTASSYKMILLQLSQENSTAYAVIQVAESLFCLCDKMPAYFSVPLICSVIMFTLKIKGTLNSWKEVFSV